MSVETPTVMPAKPQQMFGLSKRQQPSPRRGGDLLLKHWCAQYVFIYILVSAGAMCVYTNSVYIRKVYRVTREISGLYTLLISRSSFYSRPALPGSGSLFSFSLSLSVARPTHTHTYTIKGKTKRGRLESRIRHHSHRGHARRRISRHTHIFCWAAALPTKRKFFFKMRYIKYKVDVYNIRVDLGRLWNDGPVSL